MKLKLANIMVVFFFSLSPVNANADPDLLAGKQLFQMCAACHGAAGEGNQSMNAPASAGQSKWYIKQQLMNFRVGIRVSSAGYLWSSNDTYGFYA